MALTYKWQPLDPLYVFTRMDKSGNIYALVSCHKFKVAASEKKSTETRKGSFYMAWTCLSIYCPEEPSPRRQNVNSATRDTLDVMTYA